MKELLTEWRRFLREGDVKFSGILMTKPSEVMGKLKELSENLPPDAVVLPEDKWHVTLVHQSILKPYRKQLKTMDFPPAPVAKLTNKIVERSDGEKKSWAVFLQNQDEMREYVNHIMEQLGGESNPEPERRFHISLANLTGNPTDSVR